VSSLESEFVIAAAIEETCRRALSFPADNQDVLGRKC